VTEASPGRPPAPTPAERARTIAARGGKVSLRYCSSRDGDEPVTPYFHESPADSGRTSPLLLHVHNDSSATVLLDRDHQLVHATRHRPDGLAAMLELADTAPVALREPIRGLLWITGLIQVLGDGADRDRALLVAEARPDPRLLDIGHGVVVLKLVPASLVLADAEGTYSVDSADFTAASPDPFYAFEAGWLRHLEVSHVDVVGMLARHLPEHLRGSHVRPLGLDRFGLRLRVEAVDADHDVRLAFARPVNTTAELSDELRRLLGCPFLAATGRG
jgi:hypothetical protein